MCQNQQVLLAYCSDTYFYFHLDCGDWCERRLFSREGNPYPCPDNNYRATPFVYHNDTLQFSIRDSLLNTISVNVISVNVSSGVCFESQNITYFAYSDPQHNYIYVYDFTTQNYYPVSPYDCSHVHQDCPQLLILENEYLAIHDAIHNLVFDTTTNFSLIINISSGIADILAILHSNIYSAITPSHPNIHSTTTKVPPAPGIYI